MLHCTALCYRELRPSTGGLSTGTLLVTRPWHMYTGRYRGLFNRPGVARAVLQTPSLLIHSVSWWSFSSKSSKCLYFKTVRARELKFWENIQLNILLVHYNFLLVQPIQFLIGPIWFLIGPTNTISYWSNMIISYRSNTIPYWSNQYDF